MFKLSFGDLFRGLVMAVLSAVVVAFIGVLDRVITPEFDLFTLDYGALFRELTNSLIIAAYSAGGGYLLKNILTDDKQRFLGVV